MPGFSGNNNGARVVFADNIDLTGQSIPGNTMVTDGQLLIAHTALNAGGTHIDVGNIRSPLGTLSVGYSSPNINLDVISSAFDLHVAKLIVNSTPNAGGNYTTISAALTAAVSGDTIFVMPGATGIYTENLTLKAGVNLTAFGSDSSLNGTGKVIISGTCTMTTAGSVTISGIQLQTNSAALLAVTGSAASIVNLNNCYLNCTNATGITFSSSSGSAVININNCLGDIGTTGISLFSHSSGGGLGLNYCIISNNGLSTTASTCSSGTIGFFSSNVGFATTTSSSGVIVGGQSVFNTSAINTTALTIGGGTSTLLSCSIAGGSASAISIGNTTSMINCTVNSTNTNAISGVGTISYAGLIFSGTSYKINTTTQLGGTIQGGLTQAPSAGFLGERIEATATSIAITNNTPKTICSITLTPGIWDVSGMGGTVATGGTGVAQAIQVNISTTDNTIVGTFGVELAQNNASLNFVVNALSVPSVRKTITTSTTYYLVMLVVYSSTTSPCNARISATRVG